MVSTISSPTPLPESTYPSNRVVLQGVSWQIYKALMADIGDNRICRIAYFRGILEIRMPLTEHEEPVQLLGDFVKGIADELEIELRCLGALLLERDDLSRAIEPDTCFYIQNEAKVRSKTEGQRASVRLFRSHIKEILNWFK